jgi:hypothetical protein
VARLLAYHDALGAPEQPWTVAGVLGGLGLLWGEAGVGKSFVACSLAASVATGRPWLGHRVAEGPVVYVAGEGGALGVARRLDAAVSALRCCDEDDGPVPLWIVTPGVDLVAGPAELVSVMDGVQPQLVIVDTLARCFGGDENSSEDMSRFVRTLDLLRDIYGCSVLVIHHANKTEKAGAGKVRGSSVLYGAVDVSLQLQLGDKRGDARLVADKLRDRDVTAPVAEMRFESVPVWGERDELGDQRTTRVVRPSAAFEAALPEVASVPLRSVTTYEAWRSACPHYPKETFDRIVVAVLGDPETWGVEQIAPGVFGALAPERERA